MSDAGFIVVHRKAMQSWLWQISDSDFKLALTCLLMANWQSGKWFDGAKMVHVERGSFITSAEKLATRCGPGFTRKKIRGGLARLQAAEFLKLGTHQGQRWTLITIENYSKYQDKPESVGHVVGQVGAMSGPSEGQVGATIEQVNKGTSKQGNKQHTLPGLPADGVSVPARPARWKPTDSQLEAVYLAYPKRTEKAKGLAKLRGYLWTEPEFEQLEACVEAMGRGWAGADTTYCPGFLPFVNGKRWMDDEWPMPSRDLKPTRATTIDFSDERIL